MQKAKQKLNPSFFEDCQTDDVSYGDLSIYIWKITVKEVSLKLHQNNFSF